jgi:hypothetical protein
LLPQTPERDQAVEITEAALESGEVAADIWEDARDENPVGWGKWVMNALRGLGALLDLIKASGVPVPLALSMALASASGLLSILDGL